MGERHLARLTTIPLLVSFTIAILIVVGFVIFPNRVDVFWREDSLVEYLQFLLYLLAAILQFLSTYRCIRGGELRLGVFHLLLSLLFLTVGMEEISWGQRIIGWETPDFIEEINLQDETNIHNLFPGSFSPLHLAIMLFIYIYCYTIPILYHGSKSIRALVNDIKIPVIGIDLVAIFVIADLVRPMNIANLDVQITIIVFTFPLLLYLSGKFSRFFEGIQRPDLQVLGIFLVGIAYLLFDLSSPKIPTLWIWESRELLFAVGFMFFSLIEAGKHYDILDY